MSDHELEYKILPDYQTECECDTYPDCNCEPIDKLLRERHEEEEHNDSSPRYN